MSDALTDIARDERRAKCLSAYVKAVWCFLIEQTEDAKRRVEESAVKTDLVPRGYWGKSTTICKALDDGLLLKLLNHDLQEWKLLLRLAWDTRTFEAFDALKKMAPFKTVRCCPHCDKLLFDGEK